MYVVRQLLITETDTFHDEFINIKRILELILSMLSYVLCNV